MKLKKVELSGFKSFADHVTVVFTSGLNGIVGPNGCGKSNITDAFKWVLGEQSTKALRASTMQEVIFHGTSKRKPVNLAEVTIVFSNSDRFLPVDYEEVAVTRRLYRSGESQYFLNKQPVRLRDLHDLFAHSGVGKEAFAIIEQGKVDSLVKESPIDRRALFEEAAGIMRFLDKRKESLRKLERAEEALLRVKDLYQEIERQLVHLEKQVEEAKRYTEEKQELTTLEMAQLRRRFEERERKRGRLQEKLKQLQEELVRHEQEQAALEAKLHLEKEEIAKLRAGHYASAEKLHELKTTREVLEHDIRAHADSIQRTKKRLAELNENKKNRNIEAEKIQASNIQLEGEAALKTKELQEKQALSEKLSGECVDLQQKIEQKEALFRETLNQKYAAESALQKLEAEIRQEALRHQALREKIAEKQRRLEEITKTSQLEEQELRATTEAKEGLSLECNRLREEVLALQNKRDTREKELQTLRAKEENERRQLLQHQARFSALQRMKEDLQGLSHGAKTVLKEAKRSGSLLYQKVRPLAEGLQLSEDRADWVDLFGRLYNSTLLVEKEEDLHLVLNFAKEQKLQELSLFCLELLPSGFSLEEHLFGHAAFADSLDSVKNILLQREGRPVLVKGGFYIDARGVIFFGGNKEGQKESNLVLQERELKTLRALVAEIETALSHVVKQREQLEKERVDLLRLLQENEGKLKSSERAFFEKNFQSEKLLQSVQAKKSEKERIAKELEEVVGLESVFVTEKEHEKEELKTRREALLEIEKSLKQEEEALQRMKALLRERAIQRQETERRVAHLIQERARFDVARESQVVRMQEIERSLQLIEEESARSQKSEVELQKSYDEKCTKRQELEARFLEMKDALSSEEAVEQEREKAYSSLEGSYAEVVAKRQERAVKIAEAESNISGIGEQFQTLERELQERFACSKEELFSKEPLFEGSDTELEKRCAFLRSKMPEYAHVNLRSLEDYEECKQRKQFLETEINDLESSKKELLLCIEELEKESREQFVKTFQAIKEGFSRNFSVLFEGGEADLIFTETEDPLTCGIDLVAKPPGKELKSVHLLSGGEKCLTALALLFAVFDVRPAPFCILDEVDAPLDELNVDRFNKMIKRYADRCQFLIITHNKRTMLHADRLIGVSMKERGVSQVLQLELRHEEAEALVSQ